MNKEKHFTDITSENTDLISAVSVGRSVIEFCSPSSGASHIMSPMFEELAEAYYEKANFFRVNMDSEPDSGAKFGVSAIPCFVFLVDGKIFNRIHGVISRNEFESAIDELIKA